jgi:pyruvate,water dikinase
VAEAFKRVVAGPYAPEAWLFRRRRGCKEHEAVMAVGCQAMIDSAVSGGMYTYAPMTRKEEGIFVSAAWGLCAPIMAGEIETDSFLIARKAPFPVLSREIAHKTQRLLLVPGGGTADAEVPARMTDTACLTEADLSLLGEAALSLEKYFKRPQDVEWTVDALGRLFSLQTRPLVFSGDPARRTGAIDAATREAEVVFSDAATWSSAAWPWARCSWSAMTTTWTTFPSVPSWSRARPRRATPGSWPGPGHSHRRRFPAGHMATVAREFRLPTIVGCGLATSALKTGDEITVDATQNVVYRGLVKELRYFELTEEAVYEDSYEYRLLRRLLKKITPLNLVDPHAANFTPPPAAPTTTSPATSTSRPWPNSSP